MKTNNAEMYEKRKLRNRDDDGVDVAGCMQVIEYRWKKSDDVRLFCMLWRIIGWFYDFLYK